MLVDTVQRAHRLPANTSAPRMVTMINYNYLTTTLRCQRIPYHTRDPVTSD